MAAGTRDVDVAVIGLGVLGLAALHQLALDGVDALGVERSRVGHGDGSSHGRSRAVRFLYHAPEYVELLPTAVAGWAALEHATGFAPVIGRILADLATVGRSRRPIDRFRIDRFAHATAGA